MKHIGLNAVAMAAVIALAASASAQEAGKAGAPAAGGAAAGGAAGAEGGTPRILPPNGAAPASPGMKPATGAEPEPGARKAGENAGVSPAQQPTAPGEPTQKKVEDQNQPVAKPGTAAQPAGKAGQAQPGEAQKQNPQAAGKANGQSRPAPKITNVQETKIQQTIRQVNVSPVHVDFNIGVGVAVPSSVVLTPLPPAIISIVPGYEDFRFFVVPGQIVIVDPVTLEIVAVLPL